MKKLIIAMSAVAMTVVANAAAVSWASGKFYTPASAEGGFSSTAAKATVTGYLITLTASEYASYLATYNTSGNMSHVYEAYKDSLSGGTKSASLTSTLTLSSTADVGDTVYAAVIYTTTATFDDVATDFYIANIGTGTVGAESGLSIGNLGTAYLGGTSTASIGGWQTAAVPEPTSGLLMLLGMAGLALRRRRA